MPNQIKKDLDLYISETRVFNESDEEKVFEKIKMLENRKKTRRLQNLLPQMMSFVGIAILISVIIGVFVLYSGIKDSNKLTQKPLDKGHLENQKQANNPTNVETKGNSFDFNSIQVGDKVGNWTLIALEKTPEQFVQKSFSAQFSGDMTLTGTLICLNKVEYGFQKGAVVFFPNEKLAIPFSRRTDAQKPMLVNNQYTEAQKFAIKPGEKREGASLHIQKIIYSGDQSGSETDQLYLYNENDTKISISHEHAPETLIMDGLSYVKSEHPDKLNEFAKRIDGMVYGVEGSDVGFVIKNYRIVLTSSSGIYRVSYDYVNDFKEIILSKYQPNVNGLTEDFDKFLQTGEPIGIRESNSYKIYDESGKVVIHMPM